MRREIGKILGLIVLSLFLCVSSFAQNKIGVVDTKACEDEKTGIKELSAAIKVYNSKQSINQKDYESKYYSLQKKIQKLMNSKTTTDKEVAQMIGLRNELRQAQGQYATTTKKLRKEILSPIWDKIRQFIGEFLSKNGYKEFYSKVDGEIIQIDSKNAVDVTNEFIKFCNEEFEKEASERRASSRH
jgi:Skp family chaperone for outer membrane proteins